MTDFADDATKLQQQQLKRALNRHLNRAASTEALTHCRGCGEEIPETRRDLVPGCTHCTFCQNERE